MGEATTAATTGVVTGESIPVASVPAFAWLARRVLAEGGWGALASMLVPLVLAVALAWWGGRVGARTKEARGEKRA